MVALHAHEWPTDAGTDAPVAVLVHGISGWWRTWRRVGPALAGHGWRTFGVDLPGHGGSPPIDGTTTREAMSRDLEQTIEALEIAPIDVMIGHSLGAAVVQELVHRRPDLARRAVFEDPPATDRVGDTAFLDRLAAESAAARRDPVAERARERRENPAWEEEDVRQDVEGRALSDTDGILASLRVGMGSRVPELAPVLRVPALYLLATEARSAIGGSRRAQLLAGLPANARVVELESGHVIHRDRFDEYLSTILDWLGGPPEA